MIVIFDCAEHNRTDLSTRDKYGKSKKNISTNILLLPKHPHFYLLSIASPFFPTSHFHPIILISTCIKSTEHIVGAALLLYISSVLVHRNRPFWSMHHENICHLTTIYSAITLWEMRCGCYSGSSSSLPSPT